MKQCLLFQFLKLNASSFKFIYQGDDDVFVNPYKLVSLSSKTIINQSDFFLGAKNKIQLRIRNPDNRYYVPENLWPYKTYPIYTSGAGFIFTRKIGEKLLQASLNNWIFPIDDAFVGVLLKYINVKPIMDETFYSRGYKIDGRNVNLIKGPCEWIKNVTIFHRSLPNDQIALWDKLKSC